MARKPKLIEFLFFPKFSFLVCSLIFLTGFLVNCQSLSHLEKSRLNHPGMSLSKTLTPSANASFTGLNAIGSQKGGACTVCAK